MPRYFYHPLGDYAKNYVNGSASFGQQPHTRIDHGFNKIDYGCGGNINIYSMTNGTVSTAGWIGNDGVSRYGVIVRCVDNGYSEMMAAQRGGTVEDFPIYISYIEMNEEPKVSVGSIVKPGTLLGTTNSVYYNSNVHIDIGAYDRYSNKGNNNPNIVADALDYRNQLAIGFDRYDAYGDKGENFDFTKYVKSLKLDGNKNFIDQSGACYGILSDDNLYYPSGVSGEPIKFQTVGVYPHYGTSSTPCPINRFYHYAIAFQKPIYLQASSAPVSGGKAYDKNVDINNYITYTETEKQIALGVMSFEAGAGAPMASLECWGRVLRNRIAQGYNTNLATCATGWLGGGQSYNRQNALTYYQNIYLNFEKEKQDVLWGTVCGNNYNYIEDAVNSGTSGGWENTKYGSPEYLYNFNMLGAYHWWMPQNAVAWVNGANGKISPCYAPDVNTKGTLFPIPS